MNRNAKHGESDYPEGLLAEFFFAAQGRGLSIRDAASEANRKASEWMRARTGFEGILNEFGIIPVWA